MNKNVKISLTVWITLVLLLAIAIPALARTNACKLSWPAYDQFGETSYIFINGESELSLIGSTLTKTCTGNIPLGETAYGNLTYFTLDEMRDYICETYGENDPDDPACNIGQPFTLSPKETDGTIFYLESYRGVSLSTLDWWVQVFNNGDFLWEATFILE